MSRHRRRTFVNGPRAVLLALALGAPAAGASGLPDPMVEAAFLVDAPGASTSIAAGFFNPAAWAVQRTGGLYLGWDDERRGRDTYAGMVSLRHLGFGARRFDLDGGAHVDDYTFGVALGDHGGALGVAYAWGAGDTGAGPRHERLTVGSILRHRFASLGAASTWDLERRDSYLQVDVGVRPLGPRLTLFGDAVVRRGESFEDIRSGYGAELRLLPGLGVAARGRSTGEVAFRVGIGLGPHTTASARPRLDDDGDRVATHYALEWGPPRPGLGHGLLGRGRAFPEIELRGRMAYQRYRFFDSRRTLFATLERIDALAVDPRVGGLLLNLSGMDIGPGMMWELRQQLAGFRARGKRVVVYVDRTSFFQYMLASVADEIWIDPQGMVEILGVNAGRTYMRHTLDKLGLGVDELRIFTYKSAFEGYARDSMSEPDREQRQALVDDSYDTVAKVVTAARGVERQRWDALVNDEGVLLPAAAQKAGLVDSIGDFHAARKAARRAARRTSQDGDGAALGGIHGDPVWSAESWGELPRIAVLYAIGPCAMDEGIRGRTLSRRIRRAREDRRVRALVLRADSPGGDPLPSDLVARELLETSKKKPVVVSQGQVAASGGYWISMYGRPIVASPLTITGSIGVIGGHVWNDGFGSKLGLTYDHVQRGAHADLFQGLRVPLLNQGVPERPLSAEERDHALDLMRDLYGDFVRKVGRGRDLGEAYVDSIGQGRVWSGKRGLELGLVDELGGLWHALGVAKRAAGLAPERPVHIDEGPSLGALDLSALRPRLLGAEMPVPAAASPLEAAEAAYVRALAASRGRPLVLMEPLRLDDGAAPSP